MEEPVLEFKHVKQYRLKKQLLDYEDESPTVEQVIMTCWILSEFTIKDELYDSLPESHQKFFELYDPS